MSDGIKTHTSRAASSRLRSTAPRRTCAIDRAASRRLNDVFSGFRDDPALRVAIITGAGEALLLARLRPLKAAAAGEKSDEDWGVGGFGGLNYPRNLDKPC